MTVEEFCERYMDGKTPVGLQEDAIYYFLLWMKRPLFSQGWGAGKTTVRQAMIRYIEEIEACSCAYAEYVDWECPIHGSQVAD